LNRIMSDLVRIVEDAAVADSAVDALPS
jgi:hypothetical protein